MSSSLLLGMGRRAMHIVSRRVSSGASSRSRLTNTSSDNFAMAAALPTDKAPALLSPFNLSGLELRNRVALAPLTRGRSTVDRVPTDINRTYYAQRAEYAGLIIVEGTTVDATESNGWLQNAGIYTAEQVEAWKPIIDAVHERGSKIVCQLWHLGRAAHSSFTGGIPPVGPSAIVIDGSRFHSDGVWAADGTKQPYELPRALETAEIPGVVDAFRKAAANAKAAGFDGVEIHGANGYLLNSFLDSRSNKRDDQYGAQTPENRIRFLSEVIDAIETVFPANRIGVRLSPNGAYNDMGSEDSVEVYTDVLQRLGQRGLMYVHVMDGLTFGFHQLSEPVTAERIRAAYGPGAIVVNCGYTRETGDAVVAAGHADLVAYGRLFIGNPDLPYRFAHDLPLAQSDPRTWFSHDSAGYDDYKTAVEEQEAAAATTAAADVSAATTAQ